MVRRQQFRSRHGFVVGLASCMLAGLALAVGTAPEFPDPGKTAMSVDQQKQLGLKVAGQVYQQMPVLSDSSVETQYIRKLGRRLVATIPAEHSWPPEFHVIAQKEINAFALPGGSMFVNTGTIWRSYLCRRRRIFNG
jgi:predicted Zn-dependent protease